MEDAYDTDQTPPNAFLFVVNGEPPTETAAPVDEKGRKRPHHKSRRGCLACKRRKVKCNERLPCSNCTKRKERCAYSAPAARKDDIASPVSQPSATPPVADDTRINLLHMELFHHFERHVVGTLVFFDIWELILPWSFQEPHIMCTILCLAATHLSTLRPDVARYSRAALALLGKSASLFGAKLTGPATAHDWEALIAASVLMHYISWSHVEFLDEQGQLPLHHLDDHEDDDDTDTNSGSRSHAAAAALTAHLAQDPLFRLSAGVRGVFAGAAALLGPASVFIAASVYSPKAAIEALVARRGLDPRRFVPRFMAVWDDPLCQPPPAATARGNGGGPLRQPQQQHEEAVMLHLEPYVPDVAAAAGAPPKGARCVTTLLQQGAGAADPQRAVFRYIAERLSLIFNLVCMAAADDAPLGEHGAEIDLFFFNFPVLCSMVFRDASLARDPRALIVLCHFYRAARILLTGPASWWARQRSRIIEGLILRELKVRGLESYVLDEPWEGG